MIIDKSLVNCTKIYVNGCLLRLFPFSLTRQLTIFGVWGCYCKKQIDVSLFMRLSCLWLVISTATLTML